MQNIQPDNLIKVKKLERRLVAAIILLLVLIIGFLAVYDLKPGQEALAISSNYNKNTGQQLSVSEWNNLPNDFIDASGDTMTGNLILNSKLGIGASSPNRQIHIYNASGDNAEIDIQSVSGANNHWGIYNERSNNSLRFWRGDDRMVITNNGEVGIGTNNPSAKLHINGGSLYVMDNGNNPLILVGDSGTDYGLLKWDSTNDKFYLGLHTSAGEKDAITIKNSGEVGIGVTDPQATLDVGGSGIRLGGKTRNKWAPDVSSGGAKYELTVKNAAFSLGVHDVCFLAGIQFADSVESGNGGNEGCKIFYSENGGDWFIDNFTTGPEFSKCYATCLDW